MSKDKIYHEHLVSNIPNTEENRKFIREMNKKSKESNSRWKMFIKYRKPKDGFQYGSGGSLRCDNANAFSVYITDRRNYYEQPEVKERSRSWDKIRKLEKENEKLKKELLVYKNPYIDWNMTELEDEISEIKSYIVDCYIDDTIGELVRLGINIEVDNQYGSITLREKYNLLVEALEYKEELNVRYNS